MKVFVESVNISERQGTAKRPVERAVVENLGISGDAHAGQWHRQVSLLGRPSIERFEKKIGRNIRPGEFGENITVAGMDMEEVSVLDRFRIGTVELEITQIGKICHGDNCAIYREVGKCVMPKEGLFARVLHTGRIEAGQEIQYLPRPFLVKVVTVSDRASAGVYEDLSGPRVLELAEKHFARSRWHMETQYEVIPDEAGRIREEVGSACEAGADVVITTGGTGIGPRDITVDVVADMADKIVPGIMDHIRIKYGMDKPNALLSRSICAIVGGTIVYTLPGSVKAVDEYMGEILTTLDHMVLMLHGLGH